MRWALSSTNDPRSERGQRLSRRSEGATFNAPQAFSAPLSDHPTCSKPSSCQWRRANSAPPIVFKLSPFASILKYAIFLCLMHLGIWTHRSGSLAWSAYCSWGDGVAQIPRHEAAHCSRKVMQARKRGQRLRTATASIRAGREIETVYVISRLCTVDSANTCKLLRVAVHPRLPPDSLAAAS